MLNKLTRIGLLAPITWSIPPKGYGPWEKVVTNIAKGLVAGGYQNVTIIATKEANIPKTKTVAVIERPLGDPSPANMPELIQQHIDFAYDYAKSNLDIIHNHFNYHPLNLLSQLSIPVVTTMHGSGMEPQSKNGYLAHKDLPFVSISNAERHFIPELNYIATVYNGIDFEQFVFCSQPENYLVSVGRIHPTKGVHNAIALAERVGMPLKIAGMVQNDQQSYFDEQIKPHLKVGSIDYLGELGQTEVVKLVGQAKAAIGLIEWEEPFGLSVAEAMASGTPVIGTPRGAHKEIIQDGITGLLVDNVDIAVKRFPEITAINRRQCRVAASQMFSLEKMVDGYLGVYRQLVS